MSAQSLTPRQRVAQPMIHLTPDFIMLADFVLAFKQFTAANQTAKDTIDKYTSGESNQAAVSLKGVTK
jgi:hypothetical protein